MNNVDIFFDEYIKKQELENNKIKEMLSNTDYLKWIESHTNDNNTIIYGDDFYESDLSDIDKENINNLPLFFVGIEQYANENYIYPDNSEFGNSYKIKFNNKIFELGVLIGQGNIFYCQRVSSNDKSIDFNDIILNKKLDNADYISKSLKNLEKTIISYYKKGIPAQAIINKLNNIINEIYTEENSKIYQKKKI